MKKVKKQAGVGLLEILVSLVVLSIGLLGLAMLTTTSMRFNHDSQLRSIATIQAYEMADRMRANSVGVTSGNYNNLSGIPGTPPPCTTCTPADSAQKDLFEWNSANSTLLPNGQGSVAVNGNLHTVTIRWDNERTGATGTNCSGNPAVDLSCLILTIRM